MVLPFVYVLALKIEMCIVIFTSLFNGHFRTLTCHFEAHWLEMTVSVLKPHSLLNVCSTIMTLLLRTNSFRHTFFVCLQ